MLSNSLININRCYPFEPDSKIPPPQDSTQGPFSFLKLRQCPKSPLPPKYARSPDSEMWNRWLSLFLVCCYVVLCFVMVSFMLLYMYTYIYMCMCVCGVGLMCLLFAQFLYLLCFIDLLFLYVCISCIGICVALCSVVVFSPRIPQNTPGPRISNFRICTFPNPSFIRGPRWNLVGGGILNIRSSYADLI